MARRYKVLIEQDETGVYIATAPALPGVVEQGDTVDEAFENMGAAMRFTLDSMAEEGEELPPSDAPHSVEVREPRASRLVSCQGFPIARAGKPSELSNDLGTELFAKMVRTSA
jgi:antitoxin HicB